MTNKTTHPQTPNSSIHAKLKKLQKLKNTKKINKIEAKSYLSKKIATQLKKLQKLKQKN